MSSRAVLSRDELRAARCAPASVADRLGDADIARQLAAVPGWQVRDGALERTFAFTDYRRTIAFVNAVAALADAQDHHPALQVEYGRCVVRYHTHSAGGITLSDFICAAGIDALPSAGG